MSEAQFRFISAHAAEVAGIFLPDFKRNMVYRRISKRLNALQLDSFGDYVDLLKCDGGADETQAFVNALTTNKTSFLREPHHFDHLARTALPEIRGFREASGKREIRIWSAGCSTGPEPYSIAMTLLDSFPGLANWNAKILATDIDTDVIQKASSGIYDAEELEDIPLDMRSRHFDQLDGKLLGVKSRLRNIITFNALNLHGVWPMQRKFDAIFCRNVVIYFDKAVQRVLFDRFANVLRPGGWLYLGHSESLYKVTDRFTHAGQSVYQRVG